MSLNLPVNPTTGTTAVVGTKNYVWNGTAWIVSSNYLFTSTFITVTGTTDSTSTNTGALLVEGGVGVAKRITCESLSIQDAIFESSSISVSTTATTLIDSFSISDYRGAKYLIQIDEGTGATADFEMIEIILVGDNQGTVYATEYGVTTSGGEMGDFSADLLLDNVMRLYFQAYTSTNKVIKLLRTGIVA